MAWLFWFLMRNFKQLGNVDFFNKFKSLYMGLQLSSVAAVAYKAVFAIRRFDLIVDNLFFT